MRKELVRISCPIGCSLSAVQEAKGIVPPSSLLRRIAISAAFALMTLTAAAETTMDQIAYAVPSGFGSHYGIGVDGGIFVRVAESTNWLPRTSGLPNRVVYPFDKTLPRRVTALCVDPIQEGRIAVSTAYNAYLSTNGGESWTEISSNMPVKPVDNISAIAISPQESKTVFVGTSFSGFYLTTDLGSTWTDLSDSVPDSYRGAGFYEEISALAFSPTDPNVAFLAMGHGGDIYRTTDQGKSWHQLQFPGTSSAGEVIAITFRKPDDSSLEWEPQVHGEKERWVLSGNEWQRVSVEEPAALRTTDERKRSLRLKTGQNRTGIYINSVHTSGERLKAHIELLREHGMDSIVVDMKDDMGRIRYDTKLDLPKTYRAVGTRFSLTELLKTAHDAGLYVIGRIVVFQDPKVYAYNDYEHAVWNEKSDAPWGNRIPVRNSAGEIEKYEQREFWVDPFSESVWQYNTAIAVELEAMGVDEIQFDYIRFPSDGDTSAAYYRNRKPGMSLPDAIESFLRYAREKISVPISTDLYGFNSWYRMGNWIGQNVDVIADYVDVVCPMYYPSHFPRAFMNKLEFMERAEFIYSTGVRRARWMLGDRSVVRPYVQAFLIGRERRFEEPEYATYLRRQLEGLTTSESSGFTLWNASNIYYMITESLAPYTALNGR